MDKKTSIIVGVVVVVIIAIVAIAAIGLGSQTTDTSDGYTVTYDANGGIVEGQSTYSLKMVYFSNISATYTDHEFGGWYLDKDCTGTKMNNGDKLTKDITVYAKWTLKYTFTAPTRSESIDAFSLQTKTGLEPLEFSLIGTEYVLPDEGVSRLITNEGITEVNVVKDANGNDCLRYNDNGEYCYTMFTITGALSVTYGVITEGADTGKGYVEFTYNTSLNSVILMIGVLKAKYITSSGEFSNHEQTIIYRSLTVAEPSDLGLTGYTGDFDGWCTDLEDPAGTRVTTGTELVPRTVIELYAIFVV